MWISSNGYIWIGGLLVCCSTQNSHSHSHSMVWVGFISFAYTEFRNNHILCFDGHIFFLSTEFFIKILHSTWTWEKRRNWIQMRLPLKFLFKLQLWNFVARITTMYLTFQTISYKKQQQQNTQTYEKFK